MVTRSDLAARIDHTLLTPTATVQDVRALVDEAVAHGFAAVCVNPFFVADARERLDALREKQAHRVALCAVAAFPFGAVTAMERSVEATQSVKAGAEEIDLVPWLPRLIARDAAGLREDLLHTVRMVRAARPSCVVKVILETAALEDAAANSDEFEAMVESACVAARESGCDFVKTSTGFHHAGGATIDAVRVMKRHAGGLKVKAAGGIRDYDAACAMIDAGADRLGASASVAILAGAPS